MKLAPKKLAVILFNLGGPDAPEADPMGDLATTAGYQIESWGKVPLLRYVVATRPRA